MPIIAAMATMRIRWRLMKSAAFGTGGSGRRRRGGDPDVRGSRRRQALGEAREEIVGELGGRAVDEPGADLGELAADLRLHGIGQLGLVALRRARATTRALAVGEAGRARPARRT